VQPFKEVENYFTDSLLFQEDIDPLKQSLPDNVDSGNEPDLESEEDAPATISIEPIVAYLNDYDCNNSAENEGEWVLNENIAFDYSLCLKDVSVNVRSLHMPLLILKMARMHIQDNEESVFIVPHFKRDQSLIVFGSGRAQALTSREPDDDLEPPQFFHYARLAHRMMKKMEYSLNCIDDLNFDKGRRIPLLPFVTEGKSSNYYDRTHRGLGYITPPPQLEPESDGLLPS